jgi:hypothetical protein
VNDKALIAPCGMNCSICSRYLATKNATKSKGIEIPYCFGCREKENKCAFQKKCDLLNKNKIEYCFQCQDFPCERLQNLDKRYRIHFRMSMIDNLKLIGKEGIGEFFKKEEEKWRCEKCGEMRCCHNGLCFKCDLGKLKNKKKDKLYRWEVIS